MKRRLLLAATVGALLALTPTDDPYPISDTIDAVPLYGFWGLNGFWETPSLLDMHQRTGMSLYQVACADPVIALQIMLPQARAAGIRMTLRMTGDHGRYTRSDGRFDLHAWKAQLSPWAGTGVQEFIDDGTLVGHMLLDDIHTFPGGGPDAAEIEEMARYSKSILPNLMTYVRERATAMPEPRGGQYTVLDACVNQYKNLDGPVEPWAREQAERSRELGLGIINGLNLCDGGDGRSGQPGWRKDRWAMSAEEITAYGTVLAQVEGMGMFLNWEYDAEEPWTDGSIGADYLRQPEHEQALRELGELVARQPFVELRRP